MQLFSADATLFLIFFFKFFAPENMKKKHSQKLLIIGPDIFFLVLPIGSNLNSCSIKIFHRGTSL